jgi:carbamoyl-phosphate synthase small subunit
MTPTDRLEPGYVLLEDGRRFDGELCGISGGITGEVVFNTSMTGYQEAVTDPSYAGQIITFTYPLIGNYGVSEAAMESDGVHARGVIMREGKNFPAGPIGGSSGTLPPDPDAGGGWLDWLSDSGVPAISGVDTRALVRHIRDRGAMRGGIFPGSTAEPEARERVAAEPEMAGADLARTVAPEAPVELGTDEAGPHVVALDTGIKRSIIRQFRERGCRVTLLPCATGPEAVLERDPDLVFLANGPGDPAALDYVVETTREAGRRHLPRPPAPQPSGRPRHVQAPVRPPRRQPSGQGAGRRPHRHHLSEPRVRRAPSRRRRADRC